jgi:hypothetical protein
MALFIRTFAWLIGAGTDRAARRRQGEQAVNGCRAEGCRSLAVLRRSPRGRPGVAAETLLAWFVADDRRYWEHLFCKKHLPQLDTVKDKGVTQPDENRNA